jgi:hypothetical protein
MYPRSLSKPCTFERERCRRSNLCFGAVYFKDGVRAPLVDFSTGRTSKSTRFLYAGNKSIRLVVDETTKPKGRKRAADLVPRIAGWADHILEAPIADVQPRRAFSSLLASSNRMR